MESERLTQQSESAPVSVTASSSVFLCHAGEDTEAAKDLSCQLRQAGIRVWLDADDLRPGDLWQAELEKALQQATAFLLYVGRSEVDGWMGLEARVALDKHINDRNFRVIPFLGSGANHTLLPELLQQFQYVDYRRGRPDALKDLIAALKVVRPRKTSAHLLGEPPFLGLRPFHVKDAHLFYGRDLETQQLLDALRANSFLAVVGSSGSGKSSVVRAGLVPALRSGHYHDGASWIDSWRIAIMRPGNNPLREAAECLPSLSPGLSADACANLVSVGKELLSHGRHGLRAAIAGVVPEGVQTLFVVDQIEELFTEVPENDLRLRFVNLLLATAQLNTARPVHVLLTMRDDFYPHCLQLHPQLADRISNNQYAIHPIGPENVRELIEKRLRRAGADAEPRLVDTILEDVGDEPGALALLEHALLQLWERCHGKRLTHQAYVNIGRLSGALRNHADHVYEKDLSTESERNLARKMFLRLTHVGEDLEDARRRASRGELMRLDPESAEQVLKKLADSRLVTLSGDDVDIAHEILIRK